MVMKAIDYDREYDKSHSGLCVRFRNQNGEHVASLLPCGFDSDNSAVCWDIATPDGKVLYCGLTADLVDVFVELLGWENIES